MLNRIKQTLAPPVFEGDEDKTRMAGILNTILLAVIAVTALVSLVLWLLALVPTASLGAVGLVIPLEFGLLLMVRRGHLRLASVLLVSVMGLFFLANSILGGTNSTLSAYVIVVLVAGLVIGGWSGLVFAGLGAAAGLGITLMETAGTLPPASVPVTPTFVWAGNTGTFILAAVLVQLATRSSAAALERARRNEHALTESNRNLQASRDELAARTRDLERRARYLEATSTIARDATSVLNQEDMLGRVVTLVSEQFGFYHTGIFLVDSTGDWAVLQAASSPGGQRMLARDHRLQLSGQGLVAYAIRQGVGRIALDTGADAVYFDNPDLPETRSEAALPLVARERILGALDVQSTLPQAFTQEDITVLQTLADQVAMAISNAQLFQQAQEGLEAERRVATQVTQQVWQEMLQARRELSVVRGKVGSAITTDQQRPEIAAAWQTGRATLDTSTRSNLAAPVQVRGQVIGVIDAHKPEGSWTQEEITLVETLTEQMGVALESARLYQDTQRRAAQERILREFSDQMQRAGNMQVLIRATAEELNRILGGSRAYVRLDIAGTASQPAGEGGN